MKFNSIQFKVEGRGNLLCCASIAKERSMEDLLFDSELVEEFHQADSDYLCTPSSSTADLDMEVEFERY